MPNESSSLIRVAIIGGGPGGLGAAIAFSSLPNLEVSLYEQAYELREIGAGIRIGFNCWKVLKLLGAADGVRGHLKSSVIHRNRLTGELLKEQELSELPLPYQPRRVRRSRLQAALKVKVPDGIIQLDKRLLRIEDSNEAGVGLFFEDGTQTSADLVVGGDGIRSVVRQTIFPDHAIAFTGTTIWRVLIPTTSVGHIPNMTPETAWWHGPIGHFYSSLVGEDNVPVDAQMFEIAARSVVDPALATGKKFSWGVDATNERVQSHFTAFDPHVQAAIAQVPEGHWREFSAFAGPRLERLTAWDKVVLISDASHPLSGAFGSGAAFALEDSWLLARTIEHTRSTPLALSVFDSLRSLYYARMYRYLDEQKRRAQDVKSADPHATFAESLRARIGAFGGTGLEWIYGNDVERVWEGYLREGELEGGKEGFDQKL